MRVNKQYMNGYNKSFWMEFKMGMVGVVSFMVLLSVLGN